MINIKELIEDFFITATTNNIELYNEFSFQHELGIYLRNRLIDKNYKIEFERNVSYFGLEKNKFIKKEIDIVIYNQNEKIAIELKYPTNGQYPEQMFSIVKDVKFCEELFLNGFNNCYSITLTDDDTFFTTKRKNDSIYKKFREEKKLYGEIEKPTGDKNETIKLNNEYKLNWDNWKEQFKYAIIEMNIS